MNEKIEINPREIVILAENFHSLVNWYKDILNFKETDLYEDEYSYCNLQTESGIKIGFADMKEMGVKNPNRRNNTIILQIEVNDVNSLFNYLKEQNGSILFGPSFNEKENFWYGSFTDLEGNEIGVVDKNFP